MQNWRKTIYNIIQKDGGNSRASKIYDIVMMGMIMLSLAPLTFTTVHPETRIIELVTVSFFILDYILRWMTADYKLGRGAVSFLIYPFTLMAIVDQLSIIPVFSLMNKGFKLFRITRLFRVFRLLKFLRYTEKMRILITVFQKEKEALLSVLFIAIAYIFLTALIMFNLEPDIFNSFFDSLYWATMTLTTVGYGDICPVSDLGRFICMASSLLGIGILALSSGVITASYLEELRKEKEREQEIKAI